MKKLGKLFVLLAIVVVAATVYAAVASAVNLEVTSVEINNRDVTQAMGHTNNYKYERGEDLAIDVCVKALDTVQDAQIMADILGYRYSNQDPEKVSDSTDTFDLDQNDTDCQTLHITIPNRIDVDYYKLRITAGDRDGTSFEQDYELHISGVARSNAVQIKDYSLDPQEVIAGRAFTAMVKVKNLGTTDLTDLKATVNIPDLNVKASQYMDRLDADTSKSFEDLLLRIPECTKPGNYDVEITVDFDEFEQTVQTASIKVLASDSCALYGQNTNGTQEDRTVITVPNSQEVAQGQSVVYPIVINNAGGQSKTYTISVSGASGWSSTKLDPSSVMIVPAGQSKTAYLTVSANADAELGDKSFTLTIDSGTDTKQVALTSKITKGASTDSGFKSGLEIGLVVLVIILIILGLIIGFNKLKDNKKEPEQYY